MNSNAFFNRIEILLYSTLISAMSGINHFRASLQHSLTIPAQALPDNEVGPSPHPDQTKANSLTMSLNAIKEAILPLLLWVILGFAAGFLIGMIKPG